MKWNNNGGHVAGDEVTTGVKLADQVPQAFSHFTASVTDFDDLVCDLQVIKHVCACSIEKKEGRKRKEQKKEW